MQLVYWWIGSETNTIGQCSTGIKPSEFSKKSSKIESKPITGILLCLTVIQSLIYCISAQGVDLTRVPKVNGAGVVHAATAIIQSSRIFENDHGLLRRIAYVQSKDGTDDDTFGPESFGGIWQLNRKAFKTTKNESAYVDILRPKH